MFTTKFTVAAELTITVSVEADGPMYREELASAVGTWVEHIPEKFRLIETVNDAGEKVNIKVRCSTGAR